MRRGGALAGQGGPMTTEDPELRVLAQQVSTADIVDAMRRLHQHRCHLLDLVSPTPGRRLFGPAVTISYFPTCGAALPPERYNFKRLFYVVLPGHRTRR